MSTASSLSAAAYLPGVARASLFFVVVEFLLGGSTRVRQTGATSLLFKTTEITCDALRQGCRRVLFADPLAGDLPPSRQTDFCVLVFDPTVNYLTSINIQNLDFFDYSVS